MKKSELKFKTTCRICGGKNFTNILNLGVMPPANSFIKKSDLKKKERAFPLVVYFCKECALLQLRHVVNPNILFNKNYLYQTGASKPLVEHFKKLARKTISKHIGSKNDLVVEIGSNDGSLLEEFKDTSRILGVDPAEGMNKIALAKGVKT